MKKIKVVLLSAILSFSFIVVDIPLTSATVQTDNTIYIKNKMGKECLKGDVVFYAQLTKTLSEEKLCKVNDNEYYFWTKTGNNTEVLGTKVMGVNYIETKGKGGFSKGYDFMLTTGDMIKMRAVYSFKETIPIAGFFILNDEPIDLEPLSILIK